MVYDQLIGSGCVTKLTFSWGGNPGVGLAAAISRCRREPVAAPTRDRRAQPRRHGHALRGRRRRAAVRDPARLHRHRPARSTPARSRPSNARSPARCWRRSRRSIPMSASSTPSAPTAPATCRSGGCSAFRRRRCWRRQRSIVTVEEIVDELPQVPGAIVLPSWVVSAVCHVPGGAHPSFAMGFSVRDNEFYKAWDAISKDRDAFTAWIDKHIMGTADFAEYSRERGHLMARLHHRRVDDRQRRTAARRARRGGQAASASSASACRRRPPTSPAGCTRSSRC